MDGSRMVQSNARKGLGGQIKWTPRPWIDIISNNYGVGPRRFVHPESRPDSH